MRSSQKLAEIEDWGENNFHIGVLHLERNIWKGGGKKVKVKVRTHAWKSRKSLKGYGSREGGPLASHIWTLKLPSDATPLRSAHANHHQLTLPATSAAPQLITAHNCLHLSSPLARSHHLPACHFQSSR